jgi:hypothetical protein
MRYGGVAGETLRDALTRITRFLRDAHVPALTAR